jgi:hypothetical protein
MSYSAQPATSLESTPNAAILSRSHAYRMAWLAVCASLVLGCAQQAKAKLEPHDGGPDGASGSKASSSINVDGGTSFAVTMPDSGAGQDEALPPATSDDLASRAKHLLEAIAANNPELAADIAFPRDAYLASRDASDPSRAWEKNVRGPFARSVRTLNKRMKGLEHAQFLSIELGHSLTQVTPKKKDWKKPLWKVRHSRIAVSVEGRTQRIEIAEMTGWRGAWYVTKLR